METHNFRAKRFHECVIQICYHGEQQDMSWKMMAIISKCQEKQQYGDYMQQVTPVGYF
jgi:hypothetical protein